MSAPRETVTSVAEEGMDAMKRLGYINGYLEALWTYAWWKDGIAYVGTAGRTYREAALSFLSEQEALEPGPAILAALAEIRAVLR